MKLRNSIPCLNQCIAEKKGMFQLFIRFNSVAKNYHDNTVFLFSGKIGFRNIAASALPGAIVIVFYRAEAWLIFLIDLNQVYIGHWKYR